MRLRTPGSHLVQFAAAIGLALGGTALAATSHDYGAAPASTTATAGAMTTDRNPTSVPRKPAPARGTTMHQVRVRYGAPLQRHPAVGQPPITRWDYPGYHLYFEYNRLIHAVVPGDLEPLAHTTQLRADTP